MYHQLSMMPNLLKPHYLYENAKSQLSIYAHWEKHSQTHVIQERIPTTLSIDFSYLVNKNNLQQINLNYVKNSLIKQLFYQTSSKDYNHFTMITQSLKHYQYNSQKPIISSPNLTVYAGEHKDTGTKHYLKILKNPSQDLIQYLNKMKSLTSDFTIKITQIVHDFQGNKLLVIQQAATYGTLKNALKKAKRLDEDDAIYLSKLMLNGHIELLRQGVYWFGNQNDIQFTENGMKLSWNNSMQFTDMLNPFPELIQKLYTRKQDSSLLPFPNNKNLQDLIKVSRQNASQLSLHPLLKKKQKVCKKKGKDWLGVRQTKIRGQYFHQVIYLAATQQHGFVRVRIVDKGQIDSQLLKIYQTKNSFVKILSYYEDQTSFITVSNYANDGTVQNYVKKLKTANISLKQEQIEFFFFSMIDPLKHLHKTYGSLNMLNIRNIYIQDGIPKIGQPIPLTSGLIEKLQQRSDVPDFYHPQFKQQPVKNSNPTYDTYSLGVLIYKLMYTEYPIFPDDRVHIPTSPSYKKQLKAAIQLFFKPNMTLSDLDGQLQISDDVKKQVKVNAKLLQTGNIKKDRDKLYSQIDQKKDNLVDPVQQSEQGANVSLWKRLYRWFAARGKDSDGKYDQLEKSPYAAYRKCCIVTIVLIFYMLAFFMLYMNGLTNLFAHTRLFTRIQFKILGNPNLVVAPNYDEFFQSYQKAISQNSELAQQSVIQEVLHCKLDNKNVYYDFIRPKSPHWYIYMVLSLVNMIWLIVMKGVWLWRFSTAKIGYHYYDTTIQGENTSRYVLSSYVFAQLWFSMSLVVFYTIFNYIYHEQHSPCFGGTDWNGMTTSLFQDRDSFLTKYLPPLMFIYLFMILSFAQTAIFYQKITYDKLRNPIFAFTVFYIALFILVRLGALTYFYPSFIQNKNGIIGSSYMDFIGYFPQLLIIFQILVSLLIDAIFWKCINTQLQKFMIINSFSEQEIQLELDKKEQQQ